jgi:hypothetical protein
MAEQVPNVIGSLQNKLNSQSFNPQNIQTNSYKLLMVFLEQGVLKGPRMGEIVRTFSETQRTIAKEKEFAKDPLAVALKDKSVFQGELTGLIPTRPGAEFVGDITGSLIPYIRNKDLLVNSLSKPNSAQGTLFTRGALEFADYIEKIPGLGKKLKFTKKYFRICR